MARRALRENVLDVLRQHVRGGVALGGILGQRARHDVVDDRGQARGQLRRRGRILLGHAGEDAGTEGASKARVPVSRRYSTAPRENTSLRASRGSPPACSGDM
jgi:hypothetical protein